MVGFAPTGVVVEPSGSLLISVGGRGTRGGLYRLSYCAGDEGTAEPPMFRDPVDHSPDRLDAPVEPAHFRGGLLQAQQLVASGGRVPGESIDALLSDPDLQRQSAAWYLLGRRAVEATPEQSVRWSGYSPPTLRSGEDASVPSGGEASQLLRRREREQLLVRLALELEARGLLRWSLGGWTLEAVEPHGENETIFAQLRQLELWCRSRQADASEAEASWSDVLAGGLYASAQQRDRWMQAAPGLARLDPNQLPTNRRQAIEQMTALQLTHGDLRWELPGLSFTGRAPSIFDGYRGGRVSGWSDAQLSGWSSWLKGCGELAEEHGWDEVLEEALRTLAMLGLHDGADGDWVASWLDRDRSPSFQVLCMLVLAAGPAPLSNRCQQQLVESWLGLDETLRAWGAQVDHHWEPRLLELFEALLAGTPDLAMRLVEHPSFGTKNQAVAWWVRLPAPVKTVARGRMLEDLLAREPATWSAAQLQFVLEGGLSVELRPALHRAAGVPHLQRLVYRQLAASPERSDHAILVAGLVAPGRELPLDAWRGLQTLGPTPDPVGELPALLELLVRSENAGWTEPDRSEMVERLAALFQRLDLALPLQATRYRADAWIDGAREHLSVGQSGRLLQLAEVVDWATRLARIKQLVGEPGIGQGLFERAGCGACHGGGSAPGPDLKGVTQRFALPDLMRAIYDPSADVSDRYRPLQVLTHTGQVVIGLPIYRSVDGVTLQTAQGETLRINQDEIERLEPAERSLMPDGLLDGWSDQQLADLLAYLRQL
jgi:putative heme-binding domain-containing protein